VGEPFITHSPIFCSVLSADLCISFPLCR
jgi:hypothetical protein